MKTRAESLHDIAERTFDVCIVGAGATGAGCALDAQLRGLSTVLIDAGDFASATSSTSTKLAHGGVRYLQQAIRNFDLGQLTVLRRALHERTRMLRNAPFLAHSCEFLIPTFRRFDTLYYATGMKIYDWIAGFSVLMPSHVNSHPQTISAIPNVRADSLVGSVAYADGQFDDARFAITLVETFAQAGGSVINYARLVALDVDSSGALTSARIQDQLSGENFSIQARVFLNATGPYSDQLRTLANSELTPRLALSRGVHILLPLDDPHPSSALLIPKTEDGRVLFAIPWLGRLLVGTTDDEVSTQEPLPVTRAEAEYLLRHLNRYLTRPRRLDEIVSAFAGVRPLVRSTRTHDTKKLIRDHEIELDSRSGLISVLGGKWTTYRAMAEDAIDTVQRRLRQPVRPSGSDQYPLAGSSNYTDHYWQSLASSHSLPEASARHLAEKYGTRAADVLGLVDVDPGLIELLVPGCAPIRAQVVFSIRHEMAMTIEDILARRLGLQYFSWSLAAEAAPIVAEYLARDLSWSSSHKDSAIREYLAKIARMQEALSSPPATAT
jgi:glycerol-3-phosphate dehydrogenase